MNAFILLFALNFVFRGLTATNCESILSKVSMESAIERIIYQRLSDMEKKLHSKLEKEFSLLKNDILVLNRENSVLKHENDLLRSDLVLLNVENNELNSNIESLDRKIEMLELGLSELPLVNPANETNGKETFRRVAITGDQQIAFQARVDHKLTNLGPDQTIVFGGVDFNIGNAYNSGTGVFTCRIPGMYVFHLNLFVYPRKYVELFFMKNGQNNSPFYVGEKESLGEDSTTVMMQLETGDTVWLKTDQFHSSGHLIHPDNSLMSGFLLYRKQ